MPANPLKHKRASARFHAAALIALLLAAAAPCRAQIEPVIIKPINPATFEEKLDAAQVVVLGKVESISELPEENKTPGRNIQRNFAAVVNIEKTYKGNPGGAKLSIIFVRSDYSTVPPLLNYSRGERAVFFLRASSAAGYLETITAYTGKERPDSKLLKKLEGESASKGLTGGIAASLKLAAAPAPGGPVVVEFRIENTRTQPLLFGSTPNPAADLAITGPSGKTIYAASAARDPKSASTPLLLQPGSYFGYSSDISRIFNLSAPGKYTVTAVFKPSPARDASAYAGSVTTNSITFEIRKK